MSNLQTALQSARLEQPAREFCLTIERFNNRQRLGETLWRVARQLPKLRVWADRLGPSGLTATGYQLPDDELRFSLFIHLHELLAVDALLRPSGTPTEQLFLCDQLADDLTDIYFDLRRGLDLLHRYPLQPDCALSDWHRSYHSHWRWHAMDAECCLDRAGHGLVTVHAGA